jgi:hypothetical protein
MPLREHNRAGFNVRKFVIVYKYLYLYPMLNKVYINPTGRKAAAFVVPAHAGVYAFYMMVTNTILLLSAYKDFEK